MRRTILMLLPLAIVLSGLTNATRADETAKNKILFIGKKPDHPFGTHMYLYTCDMLAKCVKRNTDMQTVVSDGWPKDPKVLEGVKTIVVYTSPAAELLLDAEHGDAFEALMNQGVGLVTIHWASSVYKKNFDRIGRKWLGIMGATWISNVGLHTGKSPLVQLAKDHPVCRGWSDYEIHDEYYLNPTVQDATALIQVTAKQEPVVVGWVYERGDRKGRSFGTTLGHFYRNFQREPFRRMVVNGILWTAQIRVPADGADVALKDAELALPPTGR